MEYVAAVDAGGCQLEVDRPHPEPGPKPHVQPPAQAVVPIERQLGVLLLLRRPEDSTHAVGERAFRPAANRARSDPDAPVMPQSFDLAGIRETLDIEALFVQPEPHRRGHRLARAPECDEQRELLAQQRSEAVRGAGEPGGCVGPPVPQAVE